MHLNPQEFKFVLSKQDINRAASAFFRVTSDGRIYFRLLLVAVQFVLLLVALSIAKSADPAAIFMWVAGAFTALNLVLLLTGAYRAAYRGLKAELAKAWWPSGASDTEEFRCEVLESGIVFRSELSGETKIPWNSVMEVEAYNGDLYIRVRPLIMIPQAAFKDTPTDARNMKNHFIACIHMAGAKRALLIK